MGPICCGDLVTTANLKKTPGHLRWSKSPDAIILQYYHLARTQREKANASEDNTVDSDNSDDFSLPSSDHTVDLLYANAHSEDIERVHQVYIDYRSIIHILICNITGSSISSPPW